VSAPHVPSDHVLDEFLGKHNIKVSIRELGRLMIDLRASFTDEAEPLIRTNVAAEIYEKINERAVTVGDALRIARECGGLS
jgi:hypothetical protein